MSQRIRGPRRAVVALLALACAVGAANAEITLPDPLAIEIPVEGQDTILAEEPPMSDLLAGATSPLGPVTHDRVGYTFPLGPTLVTWTDGTDFASAYVYVYPFGQTPVGSTGYERGTAGTGGTNVVRDRNGKIHIAWLDSGRAIDQVLYRRGVQDPASGLISWEIEPTRISEDANDTWNSMVAVAGSDNYVHFVWHGGGSVNYYRRLRVSDYQFEPIRNTGTIGSLSNDGPDIAVRGDDEIHIVTPANADLGGEYGVSLNGGLDWTSEPIERPAPSIFMKVPAVDVDRHGNAHIVFPWQVRRSGTGRYWELRYVRRTPDGSWVDGHYMLGQFPEWQDPRADADPSNDDWDIVSGSLDIEVDANDAIHVTWHGSSTTHVFGEDEAFYIRRAASAPGVWPAAWDPYVSLWPVADGYSFAPSIALDAERKIAIPVIFYDTSVEMYDSNFRIMRDGAWDGEPARSLTTMAADGHGLSTWFPCAARDLYTHANGRVWLATAATDWPSESSSDLLIIHQRREITSAVRQTPILVGEPDGWSWTGLDDASAYDVLRGDLALLRGTGGDFSAAGTSCLAEDHPATSLTDTDDPPAGEGFWLLIRAIDGVDGGTYESRSAGQVGTRDDEIELAPDACM